MSDGLSGSCGLGRRRRAGGAKRETHARSMRNRWMAFLLLRILTESLVLSCARASCQASSRGRARRRRGGVGREEEEEEEERTSSISRTLVLSSLYFWRYLASSARAGQSARGADERVRRGGRRTALGRDDAGVGFGLWCGGHGEG